MADNVPYSKLPNSPDQPQTEWSTNISEGVNQALLSLSSSPDNIQFKQIDVLTPDPWVQATLLNTWAGKGAKVYYMKHYDGTCQFRGYLTGGTYFTIAFVLPVQLRPPRSFEVATTAGSLFATFQVGTSGNVIPLAGVGTLEMGCRFLPTNNRPDPLECFPIEVKTKFKTPPKAVVAISCKRLTSTGKDPLNSPGVPSWRFINTSNGPTVQITNIPGLEYGCRQRVLLAIVGGG